ncbi:hypothetical protein IFR04_015797 [Cadophora malorum]|uniref:WD40 repeat-like protein n=1 Tax=Cadophora malorum TaxID=108018 RepID=A0A8H7T2H2_9HELO|nr:hypothetical protein IFR04_015797 [Cadophora malorum]
MALSHDNILNPITALGFYVTDSGSCIVLAGEGSFLKAFDLVTNKLLSVCEVFDSQTIHGIAIREDGKDENALQLAIWGGASLILLERKDVESILLQHASSIKSSVIAVSDWVLDVAISPHDDCCVLITAHNTVLSAALLRDTEYPKVETLSSPSRSILYSADLVWESRAQILVAAGTVFGEIIVWRCSTTGESQVIYTFTGHEGSIFGVDISPSIVQPNGTTGRLLASCSDDRTIRIWDLSESFEPVSRSTSLLRKTGFGENDEHGTTDVATKCIATVMGHASRIWSVKFLVEEGHPSAPSICIVSFGEDSTTQHWSLDFDSSLVPTTGINSLSAVPKHKNTLRPSTLAKLSHLNTFAFHSGKHIWSTAIFDLTGSSCLLVTGGADGKISMYKLAVGAAIESPPVELNISKEPMVSTMPSYEPSRSMAWGLEDIISCLKSPIPTQDDSQKAQEPPAIVAGNVPSEALPADSKPTKRTKSNNRIKDGFNRYAFASENQVIATTNCGRVLVGDIDADVVWSEAFLPDPSSLDLKNYTVIEGFPEIGIAFLAGSNGMIFAYQTGQPIQVAGKVEGKVLDMFKILDVRNNSYELLVTELASQVATLFTIEYSSTAAPQMTYSKSCNLPPKFLVTSAGRSNGLLALGARSGILAIYETSKSADPIDIWTPPKDSPSDAIATILSLKASDSIFGSVGHFLTTERTGYYSVFSCTPTSGSNDTSTGSIVSRVHHSRLPLGPMVEAAWFRNGELYFYGFKSKSFVVWNESQHYEVSNIDCGGAHRSYAYCPPTTSSGGQFVFTKASKLYLHSQRNPSHTILKQGGHGREIKASAVTADGSLVATGAEDTAIRIWRYNNAASELDSAFDCLSIIEKHTTGIQHLQWYHSKYLFSSGGNEEFFVWAIRSLPGFGIGVVCEASYPDRSADGDLRIMSFDVTESIIGSEDGDNLLISLAFSDSTIRTYAYSKSKGFELLTTGRYTSSCLTQLRHIQILDGHIFFLTAATDGNITLWRGDISNRNNLETQSTLRHVIISSKMIHQSTIKSLDMTVSVSHFVVATGGDDNALAVSVYPIQCLQDPHVRPKIFILRSAHAAAITALSIVSPTDKNRLRIITSGNDQRVKTWQACIDLGTKSDPNRESQLELSQVGDVFTSVADVGDLSIVSAGEGCASKALVVGNGMDLWDISG